MIEIRTLYSALFQKTFSLAYKNIFNMQNKIEIKISNWKIKTNNLKICIKITLWFIFFHLCIFLKCYQIYITFIIKKINICFFQIKENNKIDSQNFNVPGRKSELGRKVVPSLSESQYKGEYMSVTMIHRAHRINRLLWRIITCSEIRTNVPCEFSQSIPNESILGDIFNIVTVNTIVTSTVMFLMLSLSIEVDGITPTGKSLSVEIKMICPKNRASWVIDYRVFKRMEWINILYLRQASINLFISIWGPFKTFPGPNFSKVI